MSVTVKDISAGVKKEKGTVEKVSLSLSLPEGLYDKLLLDALLSKKPVGIMMEEWADQNVSPQDVSIGLATLMKHIPVREKKPDPGVKMKTLSVPVSRRHYNLIRMEAMRQNSTVRALLKAWIEENTREWYVELAKPDSLREKSVRG